MVVLVSSLTLGASTITTMSAGVNYGLRSGIWHVAGLQLALILQVAAVAAGLGALLAASQPAFTTIKWLGVLYLLYLGGKLWFAKPSEVPEKSAGFQRIRPITLVLRGFSVNASNPKALIFILAILPQFLDSGRPLLKQYLLMAISMCLIDFTILAAYAGFASRIVGLLQTPRQQRSLNHLFGGMLGIEALILATVRGMKH